MSDFTPRARLYFASDHAGFALKQALMEYASTLGVAIDDMGPFELNPEDDYPDFVIPLAKKVASEEGARGVIVGKSGEGEAMAANRVPGVRAGVFYGGNPELVGLMREHNDANVLSLGAGFITGEEARAALKLFLDTPFSDEPRHARRIAKF